MFDKVNSRHIGARDRRIMPTTFPNIIRPLITKPFVPHICTLLQIPHGITSNVSLTSQRRQSPVQNLSLSPTMTLVRVCYYPRGTRSVCVTSRMTSAHPIPRATRYLDHEAEAYRKQNRTHEQARCRILFCPTNSNAYRRFIF